MSPTLPSTLALLAVLLVACGDPSAERPPEAPPATPEQIGRQLYERHGCALCHGPEGGGDGPLADSLERLPRDLRDPSAYTYGPGEREILIVLEEGISDFGKMIMPSYRHLEAADRARLASYLISIQVAEPPEEGSS